MSEILIDKFPVEPEEALNQYYEDKDSVLAHVAGGGYIELKSDGRISTHRPSGSSPLNNMSDISVFEFAYRTLGPRNNLVETDDYREMADYITEHSARFAQHEKIRVMRQDRAHMDIGEEVHQFVRHPVVGFLEDNRLDYPEYDSGLGSFIDYIGEKIARDIPLDDAVEAGFEQLVEDELKPTLQKNHFEDVVHYAQDPQYYWEGWTRYVNNQAASKLDDMDLMHHFSAYLSKRADPIDGHSYHVIPDFGNYKLADLGNLKATKQYDTEEEAIARGEELAEKKGANLVRHAKDDDGDYEGYVLMEFE